MTGIADVVVARPVPNEAGEPEFVLAAALDVGQLGRTISSVPLPPASTMTLVDRDGTILARSPSGADWIGKRVAGGSNLERLRAGAPEAIAEETGVDGVRRLYSSVPVDAGFDSGLRMSIGIDQAAALADADRTLRRQLSILAALVLIVTGAAFVVGQTFVIRPVNALRTVTTKLSAGDFAARARLTGGVRELNDLGDEIDLLACALESRKIERDAAERDLRASEDRYRLLFAQHPHPMWILDPKTLAFLDVNDAAVGHYGYARDEFLAMRITDIRPADEVPRLMEALNVEHDEAWGRSRGWRHRQKSGDVIDVEITMHRLNFDGRRAVVVTALDVTDRLRAEIALAERTALTALLADIGVAFNRPHALAQCLQGCAEGLVAYIDASCARIWTIDESEERLELRARASDCAPGQPGDVVEVVDAAGSRLARRIVDERRPRFSNDVLADGGVDASDCCRPAEMIAFVGVPLIVADRIVGVMTLLSDHLLSEPMTTGLATVAEHIALGITRHRAEEARRLLASIVTSSEDAIFATTIDGTIVSWNGGAERLYGYSAREAIGRPISIIYPPDRVGEFDDFLDGLRSGHAVVHRETVRRRKDGVGVAVALTVSPINDAGGRLTGTSVIVRDMTERKAAERSVREADERMRFALEAASVGVWEANLKTGVSYWSETCERMHGLAPGAFGSTMDAFVACIHPDDRDRITATIGKAVAEHQDAELEYQTQWPDGTVRRISSVGRITYDESGAPMRGAGVALDITDRRSLEDQLRQAQKMEAIGQLAGGIAHDFNNLLTAILGFSGFLAESMADDDERRQDVEEIKNAADRAAVLTRQLLAFGRKQILATRVMHVGDVVGELTPMLRRLVSEAIDFRTTIGDRGLVKADPGQLQQVLVNLCAGIRGCSPARTCCSRFVTPAMAWTTRPSAACSSRSSRPSRRAREPDSAWRPCTASSSRAAARSGSTAESVAARRSRSACRGPTNARRPTTRTRRRLPPAAATKRCCWSRTRTSFASSCTRC
ncbi:MAG: PAS domain S-box protein [Actinobacteria bacterium]|nr:MAG: PAS domain S-box protein [Actinomycetota bacterium]